MLKEKKMKELVHFETSKFPVTSAYISVSNSPNDRKNHLVELKKLVRYKKQTTYFKQLSEKEQNSVLSDFDRVYKWFEEEFDASKYNSSIIFSSQGDGLWEAINLKHSVNNELIVQPKPYIRPLTTIFSDYRKYAVVLVDKAKARIFESHFGEYNEYKANKVEDVESVKAGGFGGTEERRVERNKHNIIVQHYKDVARDIFELHQKKNFNWIIVGGRKEATKQFKKYLHNYITEKIEGFVELEPFAPLHEALQKVKLTEEKARKNFEIKLLHLYNDKCQQGLGIFGIENILSAIEKKQIQTLIIQGTHKLKGVFCRNDDYIAAKTLNTCPLCNSKLERTNDLIENLLHIALTQSVDIQYIEKNMDNLDNMAAILRYPSV